MAPDSGERSASGEYPTANRSQPRSSELLVDQPPVEQPSASQADRRRDGQFQQQSQTQTEKRHEAPRSQTSQTSQTAPLLQQPHRQNLSAAEDDREYASFAQPPLQFQISQGQSALDAHGIDASLPFTGGHTTRRRDAHEYGSSVMPYNPATATQAFGSLGPLDSSASAMSRASKIKHGTAALTTVSLPVREDLATLTRYLGFLPLITYDPSHNRLRWNSWFTRIVTEPVARPSK